MRPHERPNIAIPSLWSANDILARLQSQGRDAGTLILEAKGYDELAEIKQAAAVHWVAAVNADGRYGQWVYRIVRRIEDVEAAIISAVEKLQQ